MSPEAEGNAIPIRFGVQVNEDIEYERIVRRDLIEDKKRLVARVAELERELADTKAGAARTIDSLVARLEKAGADIAELEEALNRIANWPDDTTGTVEDDVRAMMMVAEDALLDSSSASVSKTSGDGNSVPESGSNALTSSRPEAPKEAGTVKKHWEEDLERYQRDTANRLDAVRLACEHGRPPGAPCPHCMGIGSAPGKPFASPQRTSEAVHKCPNPGSFSVDRDEPWECACGKVWIWDQGWKSNVAPRTCSFEFDPRGLREMAAEGAPAYGRSTLGLVRCTLPEGHEGRHASDPRTNEAKPAKNRWGGDGDLDAFYYQCVSVRGMDHGEVAPLLDELERLREHCSDKAKPSWVTGEPEDLKKVAYEFCADHAITSQRVADDLHNLLEETRTIDRERTRTETPVPRLRKSLGEMLSSFDEMVSRDDAFGARDRDRIMSLYRQQAADLLNETSTAEYSAGSLTKGEAKVSFGLIVRSRADRDRTVIVEDVNVGGLVRFAPMDVAGDGSLTAPFQSGGPRGRLETMVRERFVVDFETLDGRCLVLEDRTEP